MLETASAGETLALAQRLIECAASPREQAQAYGLRARVKCEQHDPKALDDARTALAWARECGDENTAAMCRIELAGALRLAGRHPEALEELDAADAAAHLFDDDTRCRLESDRSALLSRMGRRREALALDRRALAAALDRHDLSHAAEFAGNCAIMLATLACMDEAIRAGRQAVALAREAGIERGYVLMDEMTLAGNLADMGQFGEALELGERVVAQLREGGYLGWALNAQNDLASAYLRLGRFDRAQHLLDAPVPEAPAWARGAGRFLRAKLEQWCGRPSLAMLQEARQLFEQDGVLGDAYALHKVELELARVTAPEQAATRSAAARAWARANEHVVFERYAAMVEIEALLQLGRIREAADLAEALAAAHRPVPQAYGYYLPECWCVLRAAFAAAGRDAEAGAVVEEAAQWIRDCAARHVPPAFLRAFLERNPFNAKLLRWDAEGRRSPACPA